MNHIAIHFTVADPAQSELIVAMLGDLPISGFFEDGNQLTAYCYESDFDEAALNELFSGTNFSYTTEIVEETNWNAIWESNFDPVFLQRSENGGPEIVVRASFHEPVSTAPYELVITPKMSFGTGHHATTFQMMELMLDMDFVEKEVVDFGTGTGLLAILAEKMGAKRILAIDNDDWSMENARENIAFNNCQKIDLVKANECIVNEIKADVMLANINLNVILDNLISIGMATKPGGIVLFSGILEADLTILTSSPNFHNFKLDTVSQKNGWLIIKAIKA